LASARRSSRRRLNSKACSSGDCPILVLVPEAVGLTDRAALHFEDEESAGGCAMTKSPSPKQACACGHGGSARRTSLRGGRCGERRRRGARHESRWGGARRPGAGRESPCCGAVPEAARQVSRVRRHRRDPSGGASVRSPSTDGEPPGSVPVTAERRNRALALP
jgi:hypothetical protein